jgi:beta-lactamase regulating signal transducer with metallopeptidase domain
VSLWERIAFNVLFNSVFSFIAGVLISIAAIKLLRVKDSRRKVYLLSLPFVKIIADVIRGIPPDSYIWTNLDVLALPASFKRWLSVDVGLSEFGPVFAVKLGIGEEAIKKVHSLSFADMTYAWLLKLGVGPFIQIAIGMCLGVAGVFALRRLSNWVGFEYQRRKDRRSSEASAIEVVSIGWRTVDVYQTKAYEGTPFTGGIVRPYVCFPAEGFAKLSVEERQAVIKHELSHIKQWDLAQTLGIRLLGDLLWFIPFYRMLGRSIDRCRELVADRLAVRQGADPLRLAAALVKLGEMPGSPPESALYSAFLKRRSLLAERVRVLSEDIDELSARLSWKRGLLLSAGVLWVTGTVFSATLGGNYQIKPPSETSKYLSGLVSQFLGIEAK